MNKYIQRQKHPWKLQSTAQIVKLESQQVCSNQYGKVYSFTQEAIIAYMLQVEIKVRGQIDEHWSDWFGDLTITHTAEEQTVLSGNLSDQAALYGLLTKLWSYRLPLISVLVEEAVCEG